MPFGPQGGKWVHFPDKGIDYPASIPIRWSAGRCVGLV